MYGDVVAAKAAAIAMAASGLREGSGSSGGSGGGGTAAAGATDRAPGGGCGSTPPPKGASEPEPRGGGGMPVARALSKECSVCFEPLRQGDIVRLLPCEHVFHRGCIDPWFARSTLCPMCRGAACELS